MAAVLKAREPGARYLDALEPALLRQFERLATAPKGVANLRELILCLAFMGKLVKQDPSEGSASELVTRIQDERLKLIAAGAIKADKRVVLQSEAKGPFDLPDGWQWVRLGDLCAYIQRGKSPTYTEHPPFQVVSQKCVRWAGLDLKPARYVTLESLGGYEPVRFLQPGDLLWNSTGTGTIGRACVVPIGHARSRLVADSHVTVVRPLLTNSSYLNRWIESRFVQDEIEGSASGTTNQIELNTSAVVNQVVPLAPLTEQARIVARVDELMRLCDALEAKGRLEAEQHARLLTTVLGTLTDSRSPEELAANWQRVAAHFDLLLDRPEAVDALEQTILELAVDGLLVRQLEADEPATELLGRMLAAHDRQQNTVNARGASQAEGVLDSDETGAPRPGWVWARFGQVASVSSGVTLGRKTTIARPVARPYLRVANVQRWRVDLSSIKELVIDESELNRFQLQPGDLLITEGGDWDKVGRTAMWRGELASCLHQNHVFKVRGIVADWSPEWAELYLNSAARGYFAASAKQTTNLASINMTQLRACPFPLPPVAEQRRIVARVTQLRSLCADLRQRLSAQQTTQARLAEALVESATAA